ncbi:MAG: RHS repeat-associated core domain-containing protein [Ignavibacteriaceae bacterium]|nr:RHS repeat-associated core domain-containing protein [Ignavibacteriaceae bacterium]
MQVFSNISSKSYAGTQRVSSKIGTTENLGDFLQDWFTGGIGGPVDVIGSSFDVLENAEDGVVQVYTELGIEPPTYDSDPVFIPVASFIHGDDENEIYWFHPNHLGSTSYITNLLGEVSQHMEYFAFGETFVEEHRSSNNSPYKYNGKELDEETGWYYYGARYYDPRGSVWLSVDPLANVDYLMNNEAYINGEHNGGVFNSLNHNSYGYTYQNPVIYVDPNGKQTIAPTLGRISTRTGFDLSWQLTIPRSPVIPKIPFIPNVELIRPLFPSSPNAPRIANVDDFDWGAIDMGNTKTWPSPPIEGKLSEGNPSKLKPRQRGEKSLYDEKGGEWRPHKPDKYHPRGHWDYKSKGTNQEWQNIYPDFIIPDSSPFLDKIKIKYEKWKFERKLEEYKNQMEVYDKYIKDNFT